MPFDVNIEVAAVPMFGRLMIGIGPFDMANLVDLLDYLGTEEAREGILQAATKALAGREP